MKNIINWICIVTLFLCFVYGVTIVGKVISYKLFYENQVALTIKPLAEKVNALEKRIEVLENKK